MRAHPSPRSSLLTGRLLAALLPARASGLVLTSGLAAATQRHPGSRRLGAVGMSTSTDSRHGSRLSMLRKAMADADVGAYVVPASDPHLSEYVHPSYERRAFISDFTGSAGVALVTPSEALLWTDGRYFLQAEQQLGEDWSLMRSGQDGVPTLDKWAAANLPDGARVGLDALVHSAADAKELAGVLESAGRGLELAPLPANLVDGVWDAAPGGRPAASAAPARALPLSVAGVDASEKLAALAPAVRRAGADALVITALDEVCWLLNLRGEDVPNCPVLQAYVVVHVPLAEGAPPSATLFVDEAKVDAADGLREALAVAGVAVASYAGALGAVAEVAEAGGKVMLDGALTSHGMRLAAGERALLRPSPIAGPKAAKNEAERAGMLEAHLSDGAALANFFGWLQRAVLVEKVALDEAQIAERVRAFRAQQPGFITTSFDTICGVGSNGAIIHYNPAAAEAPSTFDGTQGMLLDSGGQYATGTTDVTRTIHLGEPSAWQRECYTRVLKGHIGLDRAVFPEGTPGPALDAFARAPLWEAGLDYQHGTGHGVGAALNVHEGPQSISTRYGNTVGLVRGMVVSNEPGFYDADGGFGIRIENLLLITKRPTANAFNSKAYLGFDQLTHVPIQTERLVDAGLLTPAEVAWIDNYHARVWERVSPRLEPGSDGLRWLETATRPMASVHEAAR